MKYVMCDVNGCCENAHHKGVQIDTCVGWVDRNTSSPIGYKPKTTVYEPYEKPEIRKMDFCEKHLKMWCRGTYEALIKEMTNK